MADKKHVKVSLYGLAVLLHNIVVASKEPSIGTQEVDMTLDQLVKEVDKRVYVSVDTLQSAIYYSNMLHEGKKFWHPQALSFDTFTRRLLPSDMEFDKMYNLVHYKNEEKKQ